MIKTTLKLLLIFLIISSCENDTIQPSENNIASDLFNLKHFISFKKSNKKKLSFRIVKIITPEISFNLTDNNYLLTIDSKGNINSKICNLIYAKYKFSEKKIEYLSKTESTTCLKTEIKLKEKAFIKVLKHISNHKIIKNIHLLFGKDQNNGLYAIFFHIIIPDFDPFSRLRML